MKAIRVCWSSRELVLSLTVAVRTIDKFLANLNSFDLITSPSIGWTFQSGLAMTFLIYWQYNGSIGKIQQEVLVSKDNPNGNYSRVKRLVHMFPGVIVVSAAIPSIFICLNVIETIDKFWGRDYAKMMYIIIIRNLFILHGLFVGHVPLYIFMTTMWSLIVEFDESNRKFKEFFKSIKGGADEEKTIDRFLTFSRSHYYLVKKVQKADRIFKLFTLVMTGIWLPTTVFAPVALLRSEWSMQVIFRLYDVVRSVFHFYGLCIVAAHVHTKSQITTVLLNNEICKRVGHSHSLVPCIKTFTESLIHTNTSITVGGMVAMRKSMILTCLSLIVPYVVLFLQLRIGAMT
ncbi:hypothetical protein DdX_14846 [Ditylenchus destructor]|uniref:Gustatory receptor n=1 Tax=Ditylenchus destructor TaxID=166010 RepID=A0AAD4MT97_9BILA|nr:hypothetical protein DdX_14846 [Ditylenchus destructor]